MHKNHELSVRPADFAHELKRGSERPGSIFRHFMEELLVRSETRLIRAETERIKAQGEQMRTAYSEASNLALAQEEAERIARFLQIKASARILPRDLAGKLLAEEAELADQLADAKAHMIGGGSDVSRSSRPSIGPHLTNYEIDREAWDAANRFVNRHPAEAADAMAVWESEMFSRYPSLTAVEIIRRAREMTKMAGG